MNDPCCPPQLVSYSGGYDDTMLFIRHCNASFDPSDINQKIFSLSSINFACIVNNRCRPKKRFVSFTSKY